MTILLAQPEQDALIPDGVVNLESFRRWATSDKFPELGWYAHLDGTLWADVNMENRLHNRLRTQFTITLGSLANAMDLGEFYSDRMWLTNEAAALSTEPDGMYVSKASEEAGLIVFHRGDEALEAVGRPDLVLEVVSPTSRKKDTIVLMDLYHRAQIPEYWLVEPLRHGRGITFDILQWTTEGYVAGAKADGWVRSEVLNGLFRLTRVSDESENEKYRVERK